MTTKEHADLLMELYEERDRADAWMVTVFVALGFFIAALVLAANGVIYLQVQAQVRYWEDATVNGVEDIDGKLIPFRSGDCWAPLIDIEAGQFVNWPKGTTAEVHYKVCDAGKYWLEDRNQQTKLEWDGDYVPDAFLCQGDNGYGDYIILNVDADGKIVGYKKPTIDDDEWSIAQ